MTQRIFIGLLAIPFFIGVVFVAVASSPFDIEYPVVELDNCADQATCKAYCDDPAHKGACLAFAKKHGFIDEARAELAEKVPEVGPGGCVGETACRAYCNDPSHGEECVLFAVENGFMDQEEADRILAEINKTGPGGCRGHEECNAYCSQPQNNRECLEFGRNEGHISEAQYQRTLQLLDRAEQGGPGGCRSDQECRVYCDDLAHIDECLAFAEEEGFIDKEDAKRLRKVGLATGPGGCKGEACREYCDDPAHQLECIDFAVKHDLMSPQEAELARKFAQSGGGPGGCQDPRECDAFCSDPANGEQCLEHAIQNGLIPPEEAERARKFLTIADQGGPGGCRGRECRDYCDNPVNRQECFGFAKEQGLIPPEEEAQFEAGLKIQQVMETSGGPGGCKTDHECMNYCSDSTHVTECVAFASTHGGISPEEAQRMVRDFTSGRFEDIGPGDDFRRFEQETLQRFEEFRLLETQFRGGFPGGPGGPGFGPPGDFPGGPGGFPGGPGGPPDGFGFVGPGGCTSPQECIKYCSTHRDECFDFGPGGPGGPPGGPGGFPGGPGGPGGFGPGPGFGPPPQLRGGIRQDIGSVSGELENCVAEVFGGEGAREQLFQTNQDEFFRKKQEAIHVCTQRLESSFGGDHGDFERIRGFIGAPPPGFDPSQHGFPGGPGGFPGGSGGFPGGPGDSFGGGSSGTASARAERNSSGGFDVMIRDGDGIERFVITPNQGQIQGTAVYSGNVGGCANEFKAERLRMGPEGFPLNVTIVDCDGNEEELRVVPAGFVPPGQQPGREPAERLESGFPQSFSPDGGIPFDRGGDFVPPGEFIPPGFDGGVSDNEQESLRAKLQQDTIYQCVANVVGVDRVRALRDGTASFDFVSREAMLRCVQGFDRVEREHDVFPDQQPFPVDDPSVGPVPVDDSAIRTDDFNQFDPARICIERGGHWDGSRCVLPSFEDFGSGSSGEPVSTEQSQPIDDPARRCAAEGGRWTGSFCEFPSVEPQPTSESVPVNDFQEPTFQPPPDGSFPPPDDFSQPPPDGSTQPPPPEGDQPPPTGRGAGGFFATLLDAILDIFR